MRENSMSEKVVNARMIERAKDISNEMKPDSSTLYRSRGMTGEFDGVKC
jgi:hypothetical protein